MVVRGYSETEARLQNHRTTDVGSPLLPWAKYSRECNLVLSQ